MCRIALSVINLLEFYDLLNDFKDNCFYAEEQGSPLDTNNGIIWNESKFGFYYEKIYWLCISWCSWLPCRVSRGKA